MHLHLKLLKMVNVGLANVPAPVDLVDVNLFQALPDLEGINVNYKGYNEYVLYGFDFNSEELGLNS